VYLCVDQKYVFYASVHFRTAEMWKDLYLVVIPNAGIRQVFAVSVLQHGQDNLVCIKLSTNSFFKSVIQNPYCVQFSMNFVSIVHLRSLCESF
jgi:hypothetical protein